MNREVFLSLLAMDAYNRGTGTLINNLGGKGSKIGRATVGEDAETILPPRDAVAAGFYAIAYEWNNNGINETVISYRGTNFPLRFVAPDVIRGLAFLPRRSNAKKPGPVSGTGRRR
jgi:hypothetical protein